MAEVPEGRLGRTRRDDGGAPAGMYLEVERDQSGAGWHVWLNHEHPSRGPSEGWDIWADTAEDVLEWLRVLDVMWVEQ
ncbi:hypothetical protein [Nitriliruptor alkaliphilus]|uniref:hypothetical protein n=1 Tax=Nitriliruptor alkaliphilus TaxID=427918 RepID=UPI0012ED51A4|nr:hypothetical protein [Nitriliruptor alkaliphilus]